jgi:HlyD family secretion protein
MRENRSMSIVNLKPPPSPHPDSPPIRGTTAQDVSRPGSHLIWYRRRGVQFAAAGGLALVLGVAWLIRSWTQSGHVVSLQGLELATVTRGSFVQDVSGRGTVIAAISPSLFATAAGTLHYAVHAGERVIQGQVLAHLSSPDLDNEYQREYATLQSMDAALARQRIELRQQLLSNRQQADLAAVRMQAALRELQREQAAWSLQVISEQRYEAEYDGYSIARLSFEHARENARLDQQQILLDLRTRTLARNAQALLVAGLKRRLDELTVRSPVSGMVAVLAQTDQSYVPQNAPLLTVVDLSALAIEFQVAESLSGGITAGVPAEITLNGETVRGAVTDISPAVQDGWVTGRARFAGPQPQGLRQNEQATVRIILGEHRDVLKMDRGAYLSPQTRFVYVIRGDEAVRTPVALGAASITEIQVLQGLHSGDRVVISDPEPFNDAPAVRLSR